MALQHEYEVVDNPEACRFEIREDGVLAGFSEYRLSAAGLTFTHTEVDPDFGGRGVGGRLARGALDAVRARGLPIVPRCPFIAAYIKDHPEYQDLVSPNA